MKFSKALKKCLKGKFITRSDWNGKNMFLFYTEEQDFVGYRFAASERIRRFLEAKNDPQDITVHGHFCMYNAQGEIVVGWIASQTDMTSDKWEIFEPQTQDKEIRPYLELGTNGSGNDGDTMTINWIECVLVKAGTFMMGSPTSEANRFSDETQHEVTITRDFYISKYPITNAQYGKTVEGKENHPVVDVTWTGANEFAQSLGGRLPTEAEWEFAARGGNKSQRYIYSGSNAIGDVAWYSSNSSSQTRPVGQKKPNELGIYDMSGNVCEWCSDRYGSNPTGAVTNPTGPSSGSSRILRGGSWFSDARYCRVAYRGYDDPSSSRISIGFRVAFPRNLNEEKKEG